MCAVASESDGSAAPQQYPLQVSMTTGPEQGNLVFVSYSHADGEWLRRVLVLLKPVVRNRRLQVWADDYIPVGDDWRRSITDAVDGSAVALLLVSGEFLASSFIMEEELPALVARGVRLVPVLVTACLWSEVPELAGVQWAHDPGRDGPLDLDADHPAAGSSGWCGSASGSSSWYRAARRPGRRSLPNRTLAHGSTHCG